MNQQWYEIASAQERVTQGDIIMRCPVVAWKNHALTISSSERIQEKLSGAIEGVQLDAVVMTQACDLEHDHVAHVILCPHSSIEHYRSGWEAAMRAAGQTPTLKSWRSHCDDIRDGFVWNLALLNSGGMGGVNTTHRIVDFKEVYTVPREFLESFINHRAEPRLRLTAPYREHLSQAFARFFMRVGLPSNSSKPWMSATGL